MKCPHCGSEDGYILAGFGCIITDADGDRLPPREIYTWRCCGNNASEKEYQLCLYRTFIELIQRQASYTTIPLQQAESSEQ